MHPARLQKDRGFEREAVVAEVYISKSTFQALSICYVRLLQTSRLIRQD